jgi:hypothetical protein
MLPKSEVWGDGDGPQPLHCPQALLFPGQSGRLGDQVVAARSYYYLSAVRHLLRNLAGSPATMDPFSDGDKATSAVWRVIGAEFCGY